MQPLTSFCALWIRCDHAVILRSYISEYTWLEPLISGRLSRLDLRTAQSTTSTSRGGPSSQPTAARPPWREMLRSGFAPPDFRPPLPPPPPPLPPPPSRAHLSRHATARAQAAIDALPARDAALLRTLRTQPRRQAETETETELKPSPLGGRFTWHCDFSIGHSCDTTAGPNSVSVFEGG